MIILLMAGGEGKRLWPLSTKSRAKQFRRLFRSENGRRESMLQRVYRQIREAVPEAGIVVTTTLDQSSLVREQLKDPVFLSPEPSRKNTFPAISLAAACMHDVLHAGEDEPVVVCPADHFVAADYYRTAAEMSRLLKKKDADLVLLGVRPSFPSERYGYLIPAEKDRPGFVARFKEKPDKKTAEELIARGGLWHAGVYAFRLGRLLHSANSLFGTCEYHALLAAWDSLPAISFEHAFTEKAGAVRYLEYAGPWRDIGSWPMLAAALSSR